MGKVQDLSGRKAVEKIRELTDKKIAFLCTYKNDDELESRPMSIQDVDDDGTIWFMSKAGSDKNNQIEKNDQVEILYADNSSSEYCSITGKATLLRDQAIIDRLWRPFAKAWFNEGKDDPEITLIKVEPSKAFYWDTQHNKMIALMKMAAGAVLGKELDDSLEGSLDV